MLSKSSICIRFDKLLKRPQKRELSDRLSTRMVKCASVMPLNEHIGWEMTVPQKGLVDITLFGSDSLCEGDLKWIAAKTAKTSSPKKAFNSNATLSHLYELYIPVVEPSPVTVGFTANTNDTGVEDVKWPTAFSSQFAEMIDVLRQSGARFRAVIGSATEEEQAQCRRNTLRSIDVGRIDVDTYIGKSVKVRILLRLPSEPTIRLRTVLAEAIPGIGFRYLGNMGDESVAHKWSNPLKDAPVLPDCAARVMLLEPELSESIVGIEVCEESAKTIPVSHKNPKAKGSVVIGRAGDVTGTKRKISIGHIDLRRHLQVVGQTGCGKSTLLSTVILSAIAQGHPVTFFDPHGTTIDTVLRCVPEEFAHKIRVVRVGDAENPVPLNIWDSGDPDKEERNISDLCELFSDIFDPRREGIVGPRYERWLSTFAKASLAFFGRHASLESIAVISQSKDNMLKVAKPIAKDYPELFETIKNEFGQDNSTDFNNFINWYLCKFQRITGVEQLRTFLGAGANALDFNHSIDSNTVNLIDLASPAIGAHASKIFGTLTLMKFWSAAITRKKRDKTHLLVIDEASIFQSNPLPRILSEGRKFGIACVLCHQHTSQMTPEIRDALEANSANFCAFRLSPKDAANAAIRFDSPDMLTTLTRLNAFHAITTLSVEGQQTAPFTLETIRPKRQKNAEELAARIERESLETLVKPYEEYRALTKREIQQLLNDGRRISNEPISDIFLNEEKISDKTHKRHNQSEQVAKQKHMNDTDTTPGAPKQSNFLEDWYKYKKCAKAG